MEITVTGRHTAVPERFRRHIEEKLAKVPQLDARVTRCDVVITHEPNPRQAKEANRIEITCYAKRAIIRAEASADDDYGALDLASARLTERLRRQNDKRRVHRGHNKPISVHDATAGLVAEQEADLGHTNHDTVPVSPVIEKLGGDESCPIELREKVHRTSPMGVDQALDHMEAVGHDFFLYIDEDSGRPSVVYRRRGWSYGVIQLEMREGAMDDLAMEEPRSNTALTEPEKDVVNA